MRFDSTCWRSDARSYHRPYDSLGSGTRCAPQAGGDARASCAGQEHTARPLQTMAVKGCAMGNALPAPMQALMRMSSPVTIQPCSCANTRRRGWLPYGRCQQAALSRVALRLDHSNPKITVTLSGNDQPRTNKPAGKAGVQA